MSSEVALPCGHDPRKCVIGESFDEERGGSRITGDCQICWHFVHTKEYNIFYGGNGTVTPVRSYDLLPPTRQPGSLIARSEVPCTKLGAVIRKQKCGPCGGKEKPVHHCSLYGECSWQNPIGGGVRSCFSCKDYDPKVGEVRNLLYHIYPVSRNGTWQHNVEMLKQYIHLFNGKRVIAIVVDQVTDSPELVKQVFDGMAHEFIVIPNRPELREVHTFLPLFERVATANHGEATFWFHAKGVTKPHNLAVRYWTETVLETSLGYWPLIKEKLTTHPTVGTFMKIGTAQDFVGSSSQWHYSGSGLWFRNESLFGKDNWRRIDQSTYGIEAYPSLHFSAQEAGFLVHRCPIHKMDLYNVDYWNREIFPLLNQWRSENACKRTRQEAVTPCCS